MSPTGFPEAKTLERFEAGLIDLYRRAGLFVENPAAVEITEGVLYRARIPVPARVPVGTYHAETYLISRGRDRARSEEHTSELQSLIRISYAVFCLKKK